MLTPASDAVHVGWPLTPQPRTMVPMRELTMIRPDDWHLHLRDKTYLQDTVRDAVRYFHRAIVMPNLDPPVTDVSQAARYRDEILSVLPSGSQFEPLMTLYLTDQTQVQTVIDAERSDFVHAFKLYPAGATTNSSAGINTIDNLYPIFEAMQQHGVVLCLHGEVTDSDMDIFDREAAFIDRHLNSIVSTFPELKIVFEHITTSEAAQFVSDAPGNVAATITAHHLLYDRNDMLAGGIRPLFYCLPILKRGTHRHSLLEAAAYGGPQFFLGTDSAPHPRHQKEDACGCAAGCYTEHAALEMYAEAFDQLSALANLESFASLNGPDFYGLPRNQDTITLKEQPWMVPERLSFGDDELIPLRAGESVAWTVVPESSEDDPVT